MRDWLSGPWFSSKFYGVGATPNTWQGWMVTALFVLDIAVATRLSGAWRMAGIVLIPALLILIIVLKTDGGWRWRGGGD